MGKLKTKSAVLRMSWLDKIPKGKQHFRIQEDYFFCEPCAKLYAFKQISQLQQHVETDAHKTRSQKFDEKPERQLLLKQTSPASNQFFLDLCATFMAADIPLWKLENPTLQSFFEKYTSNIVPHRTTLSKNYLPKVYAQTMDKIRAKIGNLPIWMTLDETTDASGRYIANVLVGALNKDSPTKAYLLMCRQLEKTNNFTVTQLVHDALQLLWPGTSQTNINDNFLLLVTDSASYMKKAGQNLKGTYPNLLHVTCLAHAFNLVAEEVRSHFNEVDRLIGAVKKIFCKSPARVLKYKEMFPDLPLPPSPIYVRWGTWLEAVNFYAQNYKSINEILMALSNESKAIELAQKMISKKEVQSDLAYLSANYTFLATTLKEIQETTMPLSESLRILETTTQKLKEVNGAVGKSVYSKLETTIRKNSDLKIIKQISAILDGSQKELEVPFEPSRITAFKYAVLTSVDSERSFSMEKALSSERRRSLTMQNLEMQLVIHHFAVTTCAQLTQ